MKTHSAVQGGKFLREEASATIRTMILMKSSCPGKEPFEERQLPMFNSHFWFEISHDKNAKQSHLIRIEQT